VVHVAQGCQRVAVMARDSQPDPALAAALKQLRNASGITQEDAAHDARIAVSTLQAVENGRSEPSWSTVRRMTAALGASLSDLASAVEEHRR
jgi:DNA-binding XRE family transcriptional regulator